MENLVGKTVKIELVGLNGNSFNLMGHFRFAALQQGWTNEEVNVVLRECMSKDYDHLLQTLIAHTESPGWPDT